MLICTISLNRETLIAKNHHAGGLAPSRLLGSAQPLPMPASCPPCPDCPTTNSRSPESRVQTAPGTHFASEHIQAQQGACCWMRLTRAVRANLHARPSPYDVIQPRGCLPRRRHRHHLRRHHPPPSTPLPTRPKEQRGSRSGSCGGGGGSSSSRAAAADAPVAAAAAASSRSSKVAAAAAAQWQQRQEQRRRQRQKRLLELLLLLRSRLRSGNGSDGND